jgi:hypothetical protein
VQERSAANRDTKLAQIFDETIQLWTKMSMADSERHSKTRALLERMQEGTEGCVAELMQCLGQLTASVTSQTHRLLETSTALAVPAAAKEERQEMSAARQEAEARAGDLRHLEWESARQGEVTGSLTARFRDMGTAKAEPLTQPQVRNLHRCCSLALRV